MSCASGRGGAGAVVEALQIGLASGTPYQVPRPGAGIHQDGLIGPRHQGVGEVVAPDPVVLHPAPTRLSGAGEALRHLHPGSVVAQETLPTPATSTVRETSSCGGLEPPVPPGEKKKRWPRLPVRPELSADRRRAPPSTMECPSRSCSTDSTEALRPSSARSNTSPSERGWSRTRSPRPRRRPPTRSELDRPVGTEQDPVLLVRRRLQSAAPTASSRGASSSARPPATRCARAAAGRARPTVRTSSLSSSSQCQDPKREDLVDLGRVEQVAGALGAICG